MENHGINMKGKYFMDSLGSHKWLRPLIANDDSKPNVDDTHTLGSVSYRFKAIYATDFYGAVRYS